MRAASRLLVVLVTIIIAVASAAAVLLMPKGDTTVQSPTHPSLLRPRWYNHVYYGVVARPNGRIEDDVVAIARRGVQACRIRSYTRYN